MNTVICIKELAKQANPNVRALLDQAMETGATIHVRQVATKRSTRGAYKILIEDPYGFVQLTHLPQNG